MRDESAADKPGFYFQMPVEAYKTVSRAIHWAVDERMPIPGGKKGALAKKMAVQAAVLLHFAECDEAERRAIVEAGLRSYATFLGGNGGTDPAMPAEPDAPMKTHPRGQPSGGRQSERKRRAV